MTIQQMMYYEAVARHQSITRAAAELHIAQPTLSLAMQTLESETGLNLFRHVGRNIELTADGQALCAVTRDIDGVLAFIRTHLAFSDVVVMVSGDPGYFSLLDALRRTFPEELIDVIPGISAIQFAFARLALPWHDAELLSFHGRVPEDGALVYRAGRKLGLLTDQQYHSQAIAKILLEHGWPEASRYAICARLSYEDERIERMTLGEAARFAAVGSCVIVVEG